MGGRATLVVLAAEVGGRWSKESRQFLLPKPSLHRICSSRRRKRAGFTGGVACWCTAAKSFTVSLLDGSAAGVGGSTPSVHDVLGERRYAPGLLVLVTALL